jgi:hypothetical protein
MSTYSYLFIFLLNKYIKAAALIKIYLGKSTLATLDSNVTFLFYVYNNKTINIQHYCNICITQLIEM